MKKTKYIIMGIVIVVILTLLLIANECSAKTWTMDDDEVECPGADFTGQDGIYDMFDNLTRNNEKGIVNGDHIFIYPGYYGMRERNTIAGISVTIEGKSSNSVLYLMGSSKIVSIAKSLTIANMTLEASFGQEVIDLIDEGTLTLINITFDPYLVYVKQSVFRKATIILINTTAFVYSDSLAEGVIEKHYLNVHVNDSLGNNAPNALVTIKDACGFAPWGGVEEYKEITRYTNQYGWFNWTPVTYAYYGMGFMDVHTDTPVYITVKDDSGEYGHSSWWNNETDKLYGGHNEYITLNANHPPSIKIYRSGSDVSKTTISITNDIQITFNASISDPNNDNVIIAWIIIEKGKGGLEDKGTTRGVLENGSYLFDNTTVGTYILILLGIDDNASAQSNNTHVTIVISSSTTPDDEDDEDDDDNDDTIIITPSTPYVFYAVMAVAVIIIFFKWNDIIKIFRRR